MSSAAPPRPPRRFEPPVGPASGPFWEATRRSQLVLPWCVDCGRAFFYPREVCPLCFGSAIEWRPATGDGVVYSYSIEHRPPPVGFSMGKRYVVALVELEEGVRLMTNIIGCPPDEVAVGMEVSVTWEPLSDGRQLPLFEPSPGETAP